MSRSLTVSVAGVLVLAACRRSTDATPGASGIDAATDPADTSAAAAPAVAAPRCQPVMGTGLAVHDPEDLELGDATAWPGGYAVGLVHREHAGRVAAVGLMGTDLKALRVVDLGPTLGDAQAPCLAVRGTELLAAAYAVPAHGEARELRVYDIAATGEAKALGAVTEARDDSLAFDLAPGLLVWDEATAGAAAHGVIRAATVSADGHVGAPRDVSPAESDADTPRIVANGTGYFVFWLTHRPEPGAGPVDAAPQLESVGEPRAYSWIEMTDVDAAGVPAGPARHLTPTSGHVSAYDLRPLSGEPKPAVLVVARDQGEAVDGSGGTLLRVRARGDGIEAPLAFPTEGLGRGAPMLVESEGPGPWLVWVDAHEAMRLLPLDAAGAPAGPPSPEPALEDKSPLLSLGTPGRPGTQARLLVAAPADPAAQLQVMACGR
jgi:hypothetical protein